MRVSNGAKATLFTLKAGAAMLNLEGANPGTWADALGIVVDHKTRDASNASLFNLTVVSATGSALERHLNVSSDPADPRFVTTVLARDSQLLLVQPTSMVPATRPDDSAVDAGTG